MRRPNKPDYRQALKSSAVIPGPLTIPAQEDRHGIEISAIGDLMLIGEWGKADNFAMATHQFASLRPLLENSVVLANLETTVEGAEGHIAKWPRVISSPSVIRSTLVALGVDIVNLANNHSFDGFYGGHQEVVDLLTAEMIGHFGAGPNLDSASQPASINTRGISVGFLGAVAADTRPSHVAGPSTEGVHQLEEEELLQQVRQLYPLFDHLIISLHWGVEFCDRPSPGQIRFARLLIDSGARVVVGHHAHVIQGCEHYGDGFIAYGLGNLTTADFFRDGALTIRQTDKTRSSLLLKIGLDKEQIVSIDTVPLRGQNGQILAHDQLADRYYAKANEHLAKGVTESTWRRRRFLEDVVLRTIKKLHPSLIRSLGWSHVRAFFLNIVRSIQGQGPV